MSERAPVVDAHLLAALRHAPDRDAVPSPEVSARILAAARDAVRSAPTASAGQRFTAWLIQPQVGAALATLAVATLLGVMWSAQEPPAEPAPPVAAAVPSSEPSTPSVPPARPAPPAPIAPAVTATVRPPAAPPPPAERRAAAAERREAVARERQAQVATDAVPPPPEAPAEALAKADAAAPAPPPVTAAPSAAASPAAPVAPAAPAMQARSERADANELGALAGGRASAPAALSLTARARSIDPLEALEAGGTEAWRWSASAVAGERAHGEAQRALWAALRRATQGRWQAWPGVPPSAPWLVLRQDGRQTTLRLADGALIVTDAQGRSWRAPVSAEQLRDWQQAVSSW